MTLDTAKQKLKEEAERLGVVANLQGVADGYPGEGRIYVSVREGENESLSPAQIRNRAEKLHVAASALGLDCTPVTTSGRSARAMQFVAKFAVYCYEE